MQTKNCAQSSTFARGLGRAAVLFATGCLALAGCAGDNAGTAADTTIDTAPLTLEDGQRQLEKIDRLVAERGQTAELRADARKVRDQMDVLSGLVDRLEVAPDHTVSVIMAPDGTTLLGERRPAGKPSALEGMDPTKTSMLEIYQRLAPGRSMPAVLLKDQALSSAVPAEAVEVTPEVGGGSARAAGAAKAAPTAGETGLVQSALTQADTTYFRNNYCPTGGVFPFCLVDWWNGAFATATSDHSIVNLALFAGGSSVNLEYRANGKLLSILAALVGEVDTWWSVGGHKSVSDSGCCFICACGSHYEAVKCTMRWDVTNAANKGFHFGGRFYNKPLAWNSP